MSLISRSTADAMVGAAAFLVPGPNAARVKIGTANNNTNRIELYVAKSKHGIYLRRAPRWNVAGQRRDREQKQRHGQEHNRIMGANAVELPRHHGGGQYRKDHAHSDSDERENDAPGYDQLEDVGSFGS